MFFLVYWIGLIFSDLYSLFYWSIYANFITVWFFFWGYCQRWMAVLRTCSVQHVWNLMQIQLLICILPPTAHRPPPPVPFRFINLRADLNVLIMTSPAGRVSGELRFDYANEPREICIWRRRRLMNLMQMSRLKTQLTHTHTQTHKQITNRILNIELNQLFSPGFCYFINHMQMSQFPEELIRTNF